MWSYDTDSRQSSISKQKSILFPKTNLNIQVIKGCQKTTCSLSKQCVLICLLALENWKRWAVTGTDLSLSLAERDVRGALRSTVSGGWMATQSFKNTREKVHHIKTFLQEGLHWSVWNIPEPFLPYFHLWLSICNLSSWKWSYSKIHLQMFLLQVRRVLQKKHQGSIHFSWPVHKS